MTTYSSRVKCRMDYNKFKSVFILILFTILFIKSTLSEAQFIHQRTYLGFTASFGTRSFTINSDIPELDNMKVVQEGGSAGILFGNEVFQARIHVAGLFYSAARTPRTVNRFELEGLMNYYPLKSLGIASRTQPYLVGGVAQDFIKFYGRYLSNGEGKPVNNSVSTEPELGRILQTRATVGFGIEYNIPSGISFVKLFAESRYGLPLVYQPGNMFKNTTIKNAAAINVGVSFGILQ
jgi:hypothetical protein